MILSPEQARKPRRVAGRASGSAGRAKLLFLLVWRDTGAGPKQPFEPVQGRTSDKAGETEAESPDNVERGQKL